MVNVSTVIFKKAVRILVGRTRAQHTKTESRGVGRNSHWGAVLGVWGQCPQHSKLLHFFAKII